MKGGGKKIHIYFLKIIIYYFREVNIEIFKNSSNTSSQSFQNIQGVKSIMWYQGVASFQNLSFFAEPISEVFYKISTPAISRYFSEFFEKNINGTDYNQNNRYAHLFSITFRKCELGEIFIKQINRFFFFLLIIDFFF